MNYREAALGASEWLLTQPMEDDQGPDTSLYGGSAGVLLTMLDAAQASGDERFLDRARQLAGDLVEAMPEEQHSGLYVGLAGIGFALGEFERVTGEAAGMEQVVDRLRPVVWQGWADIIYGAAGTLCWFQQVGETDMARAAARWLVSVGEPCPIGWKWRMDANTAEYMPNFSHGTSGIAYALACAGFTDEAREGARYLASVADQEDDGFRVFQFEPGGEHLYPLGWCHGPTGTARLFEILGETELRDACARTVRKSGIPERKEPGFWDNVGACCGSTGVAAFFLGLHRRTGDVDHLAFVRVLADDILERATVDGAGVRWSNIEHRLPDPVLPPQVGQMQGAAGIASFLFELDRYLDGDGAYRRWPDSPF